MGISFLFLLAVGLRSPVLFSSFHLLDKEKLLANGDRAEAEYAANLQQDHLYR